MTAGFKTVVLSSFLTTVFAWTLLGAPQFTDPPGNAPDAAAGFRGRVTDTATLLPLEGVEAWVYDERGNPAANVRSGADGIYVTPLLASGTYYVRTFNDQGYIDQVSGGAVCLADCNPTTGRAVTIAAGETAAAVDFTLNKGGSIAGVVTDATTGLPIADVAVELLNDAGRFISRTPTRADGTYASTGLPPGSYHARTANTRGYQDALHDKVECALGNCDASSGATIAVSEVAEPVGIDFALEPGGQIAGALRDGVTGRPLANASVLVFTSAGTFIGSAMTGASGTYATSGLPAGAYYGRTLNTSGYKDVLYSGTECAPTCNVLDGTPIVVSVGATAADVDFHLHMGGGVTGRVIAAATGAPIGNVAVALYGAGASLVTETLTDANGWYSLNGLTTGTYFARTGNTLGYPDKWYNNVPCRPSSCGAVGGNAIAVAEGAASSGVDFALESRAATEMAVASISVSYRSSVALSATMTSAGRPVAGRDVSWSVNGAPAGTATTNAAGIVTLQGVTLGSINAGFYPGGITATFAGDAAYQSDSGAADLTVRRITPTVGWPASPAISFGTPLGADQLNAEASVPGTLIYSPPPGSVLPVGVRQSLSVTLIPADTVNYTPAGARATIDVTDSAVAPQPTFQVLHSFATTDGSYPMAGLTQASDGSLWGTTSSGGTGGIGALYQIDRSGNVAISHAFHWSDGAFPAAELIEGDAGVLFGTTTFGTVYKANAAGDVSSIHYVSGAEGSSPSSPLVLGADGLFYGTTSSGGQNGAGTIYRVSTTGNLTLVHSFTWADGGNPSGALVRGTDGCFYGTTAYGGASGAGTVYRVDSDGTLTTLHAFTRRDGAYPTAGLRFGSDGNLYGTTPYGGSSGVGTVYRLDLAGTLTTLHSFAWNEGANPLSAPIQANDGYFYGTTSTGGPGGAGSLYRFDAAGNLAPLHVFGGPDGSNPNAGVIQAQDGYLYGTTYSGGASGLGVIFRATLTPGSIPSELVVSSAGGGVLGGAVDLSARLTSSGAPLPGEPITFALNDSPVATAVTSEDGTATARSVSLVRVHAGASNIRATFAGDAIHSPAGGTGDLTVAPGVPSIVWAAPAAITYGTTLGRTQLNASANVPGTFTYDPPKGTILASGIGQRLSVVFRPANASDYVPVSLTRSIDVRQAVPRITWSAPAAIAEGIPLGAAQLNASASVPGAFAYSPIAGSVLPAGQQTLTATFTPADPANYSIQTASAPIEVVTPEDITGARRIVWDQTITESAPFDNLRYAAYVDGARIELMEASCAPAENPGQFLCDAVLPDIQPGIHTLELGTFTILEDTVFESPHSTLMFVVVAPPPSSAPH